MKLSNIYKELDMNCEKFLKKEKDNQKNNELSNNTNIPVNQSNARNNQSFLKFEPSKISEVQGKANNFLINSYNIYKKNLLELYDTYKNNEDYKGFIKVMDKTLREKPTLKESSKSNFRFSQSKTKNDDVNYDSFFNSDKRKEMSQQFVESISSDKLRNEIKSQYKTFKDSDMKGIYTKEQEFFKTEGDYAKTDSKAVELSTKLYGSINGIADKYKNDKPTGILTVDGTISNEPASYIKQEELRLKNTYKEGSSYSYDDVSKLMKLDDLGNDIGIEGK